MKLLKHKPCPGPGLDRPCPKNSDGGLRGGRCRWCRIEGMRTYMRGTGKKRVRIGRNHMSANYKPQRDELCAAARAVEAEGLGIKGAVKVLDAMLRMC